MPEIGKYIYDWNNIGNETYHVNATYITSRQCTGHIYGYANGIDDGGESYIYLVNDKNKVGSCCIHFEFCPLCGTKL